MRKKLASCLITRNLFCSEFGDSVLTVPFEESEKTSIARLIFESLTPEEIFQIRYLILDSDRQPTFCDAAYLQCLTQLVNEAQGEWLVEMLHEQRFFTIFQPIVDAQDPCSVFAYECLFRGINEKGDMIAPDRIFDAARKNNLTNILDEAARLSAISCASDTRIDSKIFINVTPTSVINPEITMKSTVEAIAQAGYSPRQIVFELIESAKVENLDELHRIADFMREQGYQIALDDLGSGYSSLNRLMEIKPDYVKWDARLIRGIQADEYRRKVTQQLLDLAKSLGIMTVVEGIETLEEWEWARDQGADFAQGFLFARPSALPSIPEFPQIERLRA